MPELQADNFLNRLHARYPVPCKIIDWLAIVLPPLLLTPLIFIPIDLSPFILAWGIALIVSIISIRNILRYLYQGRRVHLIRPTLALLIIIGSINLISASRESADEYGRSIARTAQELCRTNGKCPKNIEGLRSSYGEYGAKFAVSYWVSPDQTLFRVRVRHNIDDRLFLEGGVQTDLREHHVSEKPRTASSDETPLGVGGFNSRGIAHAQRGEFDQAIQNYDQAIRLDPSNFDSLYNRGLAKFMTGQFLAAVPDFQQATSRHPFDPYKVIWLYLAQSRAGQNGDETLASNASKFDPKRWPGPIMSMFQGKTSVQAVLDAARTANPRIQRERQCEAYFYAGERLLIQKKEEEAIRMFREAMRIDDPRIVEYAGAKAELKRMGKLSVVTGNK